MHYGAGPVPLPDTDAVIYAFRRNVVVAASAGTGKTHRLTALYLLLALGLTSMAQPDERTAAEPVSPERIVATTFSRAAALEIEVRIEAALREVAGWDGAAPLRFEEPIRFRAELLGRELSPAELRRRAAEALSRWPGAKIDTLHGVARRLVQRHALALGLAPGARVLDEEEAQALGDLAVDEALSAALVEGGSRAEAARALMVSSGGVWPLRQRIQRLLDRLDEEGLRPEDLRLADHAAHVGVAVKELHDLARRLASLGSATFHEPAGALARALAGSPARFPAEAAGPLRDLFTRRLPARGRRLPADDELDDLIGSLPGKTKGDRAAGLVAMLLAAPGLQAREAEMIAVIADARDRLRSQKRRAGALGFGDLLRMARDALRDRPEVARAAREDIEVLLVDEFQDTSRVQRDLVYLLREREDAALARPAGASPLAEGLEGHGLFLVGDRKQSIYGFRGADVAVFSRIAAELCGRPAAEALALPEAAAHGSAEIADFVALRESRRSGAAILGFVNAFSERDFAADRGGAAPRAYEITYGPAEHLVPIAAAPASRVVFLDDDGSTPEECDPIVRESSGAAREAHLAAAYLAALCTSGDDAPRYKDVALLARRRSTIPLVELALARLTIPYVVAGRALYDAPEVRDVAELLRLLLDPRDRLALAAVLRGPMVGLSDTSLAELSLPGKGLSVPLLARWPRPSAADPSPHVDPARLAPPERARLEAFRARYGEIRRAALRMPPGEAIRAAVAAFDLDRVLAALPRAEARIGNLDRLVSIARRRGGTLAAFVRWLERRIRDEADEAEAAVFSPEDDAVRLTTIHASKGLDFDVVVLLDLNAEPRADQGALGFVTERDDAPPTLVVRHYAPRGQDRALASLHTATLKLAQTEARAREQAERRRLSYVAMTRARHTLALVGSAGKPRPGSALRSIIAGRDEGDLADVLPDVQPAAALLAAARPVPPRAVAAVSIEPHLAPRPARPPARDVEIDAASLALFRDCPRRFRLRHLLGLEEPEGGGQMDLFAEAEPAEPIRDLPPPVADDPGELPPSPYRAPLRCLGRWPREAWGCDVDPSDVLARLVAEGMPAADAETARMAQAIARFLGGGYAARAREGEIRAEETLVATTPISARPARRLVLRAGVDLRVEHGGGRVDLLAVHPGRRRADLTPFTFALRAAALALPEMQVWLGVVFLGGGGEEPVWVRGSGAEGALDGSDHARFAKDLASLGGKLAEARYEDRWEAVAVGACRKAGCGFVGACHGG
jgi:ATP-dependent helicase/nuclease subunit A